MSRFQVRAKQGLTARKHKTRLLVPIFLKFALQRQLPMPTFEALTAAYAQMSEREQYVVSAVAAYAQMSEAERQRYADLPSEAARAAASPH